MNGLAILLSTIFSLTLGAVGNYYLGHWAYSATEPKLGSFLAFVVAILSLLFGILLTLLFWYGLVISLDDDDSSTVRNGKEKFSDYFIERKRSDSKIKKIDNEQPKMIEVDGEIVPLDIILNKLSDKNHKS